MPSFRTGTVTAVVSERAGLQRVLVDAEPAYVLTQLVGPVAVGDRVVVNTTAVDLGLGTGGWHVVHWNLERTAWAPPPAGRLVKLRYTSLQVEVAAAEEGPGYAEDGLEGLPVVACALHSQLAAVAAAYKDRAPGGRLVYVMTDGGALPLALSDLVADLRRAGLLDGTVTTGQAFGGDHEAVTLASGLLAARALAGADAVACGTGPGVAGTASRWGFSGLEVAGIVDAAARLGGRPVVAARWSDADARPRHRGLSHHTATALAASSARATVALPAGSPAAAGLPPGHDVVEVAVPDVAALLADRGVAVTSMGRAPADDPGFFAHAAAAGVVAAGAWVGSAG